MRHPATGQFSTHEQIAAAARTDAAEHDQAANEVAAEAREHSKQAQIADRKGDRRSAVQHQRTAANLRAVAAGHRELASGKRRLALHHEAQIEAPTVAKRSEPLMKTVAPLSGREFFAHWL